jgi:Predicted SAM-dependent methyltransferases
MKNIPWDYPAALNDAWLYRKAHVLSRKIEAFRLVNGRGDGLDGLTIDYYAGSFLTTFRQESHFAAQAGLHRALKELHPKLPGNALPNFYWFKNFSGQGFENLNRNFEVKTIREHGLRFEVRLGESRHTGLFLDQRENRHLAKKLSRDKKVLNLFCYTGGFSVAALKGGAKEIHSVDLSKNYLKWLARNLDLNELPQERSYLHSMDAIAYLKSRRAEGRRFDVVFLDPPTFSRSKGGNFSTEKNLAGLVQSCSGLLGEGGKFFLSLNTRKLSAERFLDVLKLALKGTSLKTGKLLPLPLDFRLAPEELKNPPLKACLIS